MYTVLKKPVLQLKETVIKKYLISGLTLLVVLPITPIIALFMTGWVSTAKAETTVIEYKGQPVPSAMAPSMSAFSQDVCAVPASGGLNTGVFAVSGGTVVTDDNCVRLKNAKALHDMGLKVAAVSLLCKDEEVWDAMEMSGSPCPVGGAVGDAARAAWWELEPQRFKNLYGKNYVLGRKKEYEAEPIPLPLLTDE